MMLIWSLYAKAYDITNKNIPYLKLLEDTMENLQLGPGQRILDAGCGTGSLMVKMINKFPSLKILGVDISPAMMNKAKKKIGNNKNVEFRLQNLDEGLNLAENTFDRIVLVNSLYLLKHPERVIKEFCKILKPGGKLVIATPHNKAKLSKIFFAQRKELGTLKFITGFISNLPFLIIILLVNLCYLTKNKNFFSQEELQNILSNCNFNNIDFKLTYADQDLLVTAEK